MRVLLIRPPDPLGHSALLSHTRPINLAYIASYLIARGLTPVIVDFEVTPYSVEYLKTLLADFRPLVVGISCMTPTVTGGARIAASIKGLNPETVTVVGGSHSSGLPIETLNEFQSFDCAVFGEGEVTMAELCMRVHAGDRTFEDIDGVAWRRGGEIVVNRPRQLIEDLDGMPFPARGLLDDSRRSGHSTRGFSNDERSEEIYTSRGCPFACTFCAIQGTFGRKVRMRSPGSVEMELDSIKKNIGEIGHLIIADDTFSLKAERAAEICEVIARQGIRSWSCDTRASSVTPELLRLMKKSNCTKIAFGVESGSQRVMDLIGKKITVEQVYAAVHMARAAGIRHIEGNFIIGSDPSETPEDVELTRRMVVGLPWTFVSISVVVPYPGTPLYDNMRSKGLIQGDASWDDYVMLGRIPKWRTDHFTACDLVDIQKRIARQFYLRPGYVTRRIMETGSVQELWYWVRAGMSFMRWYIKKS